jgi:hypothetical protein
MLVAVSWISQVQICLCHPERALQPSCKFMNTPRFFCLSLALACAASLLPAQNAASGVFTLVPAQCVWRAGDNPAWSAAALDESGWQSLATSKFESDDPHIWIRCHPDFAGFPQADEDEPALQVRMAAAYEVFLNGSPIGRNGDLHSGLSGMDLIRIFPIPHPALRQSENLLSLRISRRYSDIAFVRSFASLPEFRFGNRTVLVNDRAGYIVAGLPSAFWGDVPYVVLGIVGVMLLVFSLYDRTRIAPIVLSVGFIAVAAIYALFFCGAMMINMPVWLYIDSAAIFSTISISSQYCFPFALLQRRIPPVFFVAIGSLIFYAGWHTIDVFLPLPLALSLNKLDITVFAFSMNAAGAFLVSAPAVAYWRWSRVPPAIRPIAALNILWGMNQTLFFAALLTSMGVLPGIPNFFQSWMFPVSTISQFSIIVAIIVLNLRDQRQVALHRAALTGELLAAQEIQRAIVPASLDFLPGLEIAVAFRPAREVGGDFYSCRVLPGNRQRVLIGDVSGKGAAAAMTAAVLIGAAQRHESDSPSVLLDHLNRVLTDMRLGGFATCLCAEFTTAGALSVANAGHLAPYRNGKEMEIDSGLPLGIAQEAAFTESSFELAGGDRLTLLSDGVVEARDKTGELFGFDRVAAISTQSAEIIAKTAQTFGQEDDITVLTLTFAQEVATSV